MARGDATFQEVPEDLEGIQKYLANFRADFDAHNHDGLNSLSFQTLIAETLSGRAVSLRKTAYASSTAGLWVGLVGASIKFDLGDGTNYIRWDGSALTITGSITGGSITGATITGGTFRTAASGQRIEITASDNLIHVYDASAEVVKIGTASATAITITLNANNTDGIKIITSVDATLGIRMDATGNVTFNGLRIALTDTGTGNDGYGIFIDHRGSNTGSLGISISKAGAGNALKIVNTGTGIAVDLNNAGSTAQALFIDSDTDGTSTPAVEIQNTGTAPGLLVESNGIGNDAAIQAIKDNSGDVIGASAAINSASAVIGLHFNLANSGAGLEYAFRFEGSEIVNAAVGGSQDQKVRILVGSTLYYIPCYTA